MTNFIVQCTDQNGMQHLSTFNVSECTSKYILHYGWQEVKRLCGTIDAVSTAYISTIEGRVISTLR